jgi:hypothetical protein
MCSPLVSTFWQIFITKNNVEWKPCSHVEASLPKVNVIAQVLVHKGPYNVRITTTMKIVSLSLCDCCATCMIHLFIHKKEKYNLKNKSGYNKKFQKQIE